MWCDIFSIVTHTSSRLCICDSIAICKILQKSPTVKRIRFSILAKSHLYTGIQSSEGKLPSVGSPPQGRTILSAERSWYFSPSTNFKVIQKHMGSPLVPKGKGDPVATEVSTTIAVSYTWHTSNEASEMQWLVIRCVSNWCYHRLQRTLFSSNNSLCSSVITRKWMERQSHFKLAQNTTHIANTAHPVLKLDALL